MKRLSKRFPIDSNGELVGFFVFLVYAVCITGGFLGLMYAIYTDGVKSAEDACREKGGWYTGWECIEKTK